MDGLKILKLNNHRILNRCLQFIDYSIKPTQWFLKVVYTQINIYDRSNLFMQSMHQQYVINKSTQT